MTKQKAESNKGNDMTNAVVDIRAQLRAEIEATKDRVAPPSGGKISTQGKIFTLPDGRTSSGPLKLIVLDWRIVHSYYTGIYDPAKRASPDCWALSTNLDCAPDPAKVKAAKCDSCAKCPFNEWGSAATGKGKACKESRRLAVIPTDATPDTIPLLLEVSPTGIKSFEAYVTRLNSIGKHPMEAVAEVAFKSDAHYPTLVFGVDSMLDDDQLAIAFAIRKMVDPILDRDPA